jgi:hypothetical protein
MKHPFDLARSVFLPAAGALVLGVALASCSGAGSTMPQTPQMQAQAPAAAQANPAMLQINVKSGPPSGFTYSHRLIHLDRIRSVPGASTMATSYPFDVTRHTTNCGLATCPAGPVMPKATQHFIYVNGASTVWGAPRTFITDLNASLANNTYGHILDQYVGTTANARYPVGATDVAETVSIPADPEGGVMMDEGQLMSVLHAAVAALKLTNPAYTHNFHIFLPPGVDTCQDYTTSCYSPDNTSTFVFCAYHGSVQFSDLGHVVYSVEPYQGSPTNPICYAPTTSLANATDSTLSHEFFESTSDPDPGTGYYNNFTQMEIGDECVQSAAPAYSASLNGHAYIVQKEWSNAVHGCGP